jgi:perosamine synthetase
MQEFIPLMAPDINSCDIEALTAVLESGMLVQGKEVKRLEDSISKYINVKHSIAVSSGTSALHLSLIALGIGEGDEVIIPAFSFIATANVIELVGAKPIFVDIDINTFTIDCSLIENAITSKTKAIMPVHEFGLTADMSLIKKIALKHSLFIIEDAACALGAKENNIYAGAFGDLGCFSFHPRKTITSGEGGLITTNNDTLAKKIRQLRNHGIETVNNKMEFVIPGFNYRMTDFQAALLNSMFKRFENILTIKKHLASIYSKEINNKYITIPSQQKGKDHSWQTYHVLLDNKLNQEDIIKLLKSKEIGTNYGAQCIPNEQFYKRKYNLDCKTFFPNAMTAYKQGLALPLYEKLSKEQIAYISKILNKIN